MGRGAYKCTAMVLRKTKLGEADVIVDLMDAEGQLVRAVAHGARKPKNPFSTRLDLFSVCDLLLARGRRLDVVSEARLVSAHDALKRDAMRVTALEPVLEALDKTVQGGLKVPRLFDMAESLLEHGDTAPVEACPLLCASFLLKLFAVMGVRPCLDRCVVCGAPVDLEGRRTVRFSVEAGGVVGDECVLSEATTAVDARAVRWADALVRMTFDQVADAKASVGDAFDVLRLCQAWARQNMGVNLRSLQFLMTSGMY